MVNKKYYDLKEDIDKYPDAWLRVILSARGPGKTYSTLKYMLENNERFCFIKRTKKDVNMIVKYEDFNPFKALNRDLGTDISTDKFDDGIGIFKNGDDVIGYIFSLAGVADIKGFELSELNYMIFDEYIPMKGARLNRSEGLNLLDLYETIKRDRKARGRNELELILLGNPVNITCPINNTLYLVNYLEDMQRTDKEFYYIKEARVMIHMLKSDKYYISTKEDEEEGINILMKGSSWYNTNKEGTFGYNDFDKIDKKSLKGYRAVFCVKRDRDIMTVYRKNGLYYVTSSKTDLDIRIYNLDIETEQHSFYDEVYFQFKGLIIDGKVQFQKYAYYDLFFHFKDYFSLT